MSKDDILVIKCNLPLKQKELNEAYRNFVTMKTLGVVLLTPGFEALICPKDIEIKMEDTDE